MSAQLDAPEAGGAQVACLTLSSLPPALLCEVFAHTPVDARARCAAVCKAWREVLLERSMWTRLDLSPAGGVALARVTDALLRAAAAKARGGLTALDVSGCGRLAHETLLEVVTANAGALTELRQQLLTDTVTAEQVEALLGAAPLLRVCHADAHAAAAAACRMLRNEPPFGPLRLNTLLVHAAWPGGEADVRAFAADMMASASSLSNLMLNRAPLDGHGALDAVVDAALIRRLPHLALYHSSLSHASVVRALARLLGGSTLKTLILQHIGPEPLFFSGPEGSAAILAAALRANNTLIELALSFANVWHDAAAAETLLNALTAHPSVHYLHLDCNAVRAAEYAGRVTLCSRRRGSGPAGGRAARQHTPVCAGVFAQRHV
jgi:hypothetical protein